MGAATVAPWPGATTSRSSAAGTSAAPRSPRRSSRTRSSRPGSPNAIRVTSAGTGSWHVGDPADSRAAALLAEHGYVDTHVARQVDDELLAADLLVALDAGHLRALRRIAPDPERVQLLRAFDPEAPAGAGVPDPYYGGPEGFTEVLTMIRAAMPGLLEYVKAQL